ncbi:unnamed protein product, partial [Polarella glacialis]
VKLLGFDLVEDPNSPKAVVEEPDASKMPSLPQVSAKQPHGVKKKPRGFLRTEAPPESDRNTALSRAPRRQTFQRIDCGMKDLKGESEVIGRITVDSLCGYFANSQTLLNDHVQLLGQSSMYSRTDWHKRHAYISSKLVGRPTGGP